MRRSRQEDLIEPEGDRGKPSARRDHRTGERDGILAQKIDGLRPASEAVSQIHFEKRASPYLVLCTLVAHTDYAGWRIEASQLPLFFQCADISHQPLTVIRFQRLSV